MGFLDIFRISEIKKENEELNNVISEIIKEFLGITDEEAKEKIRKVIKDRRAYAELNTLILNQNGNLEEFFKKYEVQNSKDKGIELKADFDGMISKIDALKTAKVAFNLGVRKNNKRKQYWLLFWNWIFKKGKRKNIKRRCPS